jgi:hypothetical protein
MNRILSVAVMAGVCLLATLSPAGADVLAEADRLYAQGSLESINKAVALYRTAAQQDPASYEANWKCARAHREYADRVKKQGLENWKSTCAEYGKLGMQYAQKAIELEPGKPDGYYYYGVCVGTYSDGVSIVTALTEGLKDKTQSSFEKTYAIDKMYNKAGPMLSLGRFWSVLPWPLHDRQKSLGYFREYQKAGFFGDNMEAHLFLSELLIQLGGDENKKEARGYLDKASKSADPYFKNRASQLLAELNK